MRNFERKRGEIGTRTEQTKSYYTPIYILQSIDIFRSVGLLSIWFHSTTLIRYTARRKATKMAFPASHLDKAVFVSISFYP